MAYLPIQNFFLEIAKGNVPGHALVTKFGRNPDIDTTTDPEDIWEGGATMNWPTSAGVISVSSTDADDDGNPTTNTGAQKITFEGLDGNWDEATEEVTLDGTNPVTTSGTFIRVNRAYITQAGTYRGTNEGSVQGTIGGSTMVALLGGTGQTLLGRYSVPAGKTAYLYTSQIIVGSGATTNRASVTGFQVPNADDTTQPYAGAKRIFYEANNIELVETYHPEMPITFTEKTDIWYQAEVDTNNTEVSVRFNLVLVDN